MGEGQDPRSSKDIPSHPQSPEIPQGDDDYMRNLDMQLEEGEIRVPMPQIDLQTEIEATIEIAGKVGINMADHQEAVKLVIIGEGFIGLGRGLPLAHFQSLFLQLHFKALRYRIAFCIN
ncbi:hypothetical protein R6Q59_020689 [Mikania micrantha]